MKNYVQPGDVITLAAPYDRTSGQGALVGSIFGVATTDVSSGSNAEFAVKGVFTLPKAAVTITQGEAAYWDDTNKVVTDVDTSNTHIGTFIEAAASGVSTVNVRLK